MIDDKHIQLFIQSHHVLPPSLANSTGAVNTIMTILVLGPTAGLGHWTWQGTNKGGVVSGLQHFELLDCMLRLDEGNHD